MNADLKIVRTSEFRHSGDNSRICNGAFTGVAGEFGAFLKDKTAAAAIEYGLIAAGIAVAIITVTKGLGAKLNTTFTSVSSALK